MSNIRRIAPTPTKATRKLKGLRNRFAYASAEDTDFNGYFKKEFYNK